MAEYTNLTTLEGLQVGDKVTYTFDNQRTEETLFNLTTCGYKINIAGNGSGISTRGGGYFGLDLDTSSIPNLTLYSKCGSTGVAYGTYTTYAALLYYRIAVAGALGKARGNNAYYTSATSAGGITGGTAEISSNYAYSGTQTAGGNYTLWSWGNAQGYNGRFGYGGGPITSLGGGSVTIEGGYGWYGGAATAAYLVDNPSKGYAAVGSGSGFVIGYSTTTYPTNYMGNNTALISSIVSAVDNPSCLNNSWKNSTPKIEITILETPGPSQSVIKYYNGTAFQNATISYYNGTAFVPCNAHYYDGTSWKDI